MRHFKDIHVCICVYTYDKAIFKKQENVKLKIQDSGYHGW